MSEPKRKRTYRNWLTIDLYNSLLTSKESDPWRADMFAALKARKADDVLHSLAINGIFENDYSIEYQIAAAIIKGETSGVIEDDDGSVYFWDLTVDIQL